MLEFSPAVEAAALYLLIGVFTIGALVNLIGPRPIRAEYERWGYPKNFRFVTAALEAITVALLLLPSTRLAGLALGAAIMVAAIATLVRAGQYRQTAPAGIVLVLSLLLL